MTSSGNIRFQGSVHDGGLVSVNYHVLSVFQNAVSGPTGLQPILIEHSGELNGFLGFGWSRDDNWDEAVSNNTVAANWKTIKNAAASSTTTLYTDTDFFQAAEAAASGLSGVFVFKL